MKTIIAFLGLLLMISACGSSQGKDPVTIDEPITPSLDDYELLFIGNSHSSFNGLPGLVATLIEIADPGIKVNTVNAPGWKFLAERVGDGNTLELLQSRKWSHVFLQAQKYSSSGLYSYPTTAAEEWIRQVKQQQATPILFPEWPRRGNYEEGLRIHELHLYIASQEPACVAPVGLVWDEMIATYPNVDLHASDGNHSNLNGALLTAFVFYQILTNQSSADLPFVSQINVSEVLQKQMREVASSVIEANLKCQ